LADAARQFEPGDMHDDDDDDGNQVSVVLSGGG
jgi:hypothetical protein